MSAQKGRAFLLKVTDGITPVVFQTVGGLRSTGLTINNELVDITDKNSQGWRDLLADAGVRTISISAAGVFKDSAAEGLIQGYALDASLHVYQVIFEDEAMFTGTFQVASLEQTGEYNGAREYSLTLESSGIVEFEAAP